MKKLRRPGNSIPTWKLICGIILCVYGFGCFVAPTGMSTGVAIVTGIILILCGVALIKSYANSVFENPKEQHEMKIRNVDAYCAQKAQDADRYFAAQKQRADEYVAGLQNEIRQLEEERNTLEKQTLPKAIFPDVDIPGTSEEVKNKIVILRRQQAEMAKTGEALKISTPSPTRPSLAKGKQLLRSFNAECAAVLSGVTLRSNDASRKKVAHSFESLNRLFSADGVQISERYLESKLEELTCAHAALVKQEEEKEQRRAIREQMVEEEKVRKEIEREKQKIEKEEAQFSGEISKLSAYLQKAQDDAERTIYIHKIEELQKKLEELQKDKDNVLEREQNTRAGFVYIISNIGSFGENVYKIGMTRRLEPMDRIAELSSASVPFPFDVHALIFSADAPALETTLHQYFDAKRVNRVNTRKEFFHVDLAEIKKVVLENHNATVKFVDIPEAIEYRETLSLENQAS